MSMKVYLFESFDHENLKVFRDGAFAIEFIQAQKDNKDKPNYHFYIAELESNLDIHRVLEAVTNDDRSLKLLQWTSEYYDSSKVLKSRWNIHIQYVRTETKFIGPDEDWLADADVAISNLDWIGTV